MTFLPDSEPAPPVTLRDEVSLPLTAHDGLSLDARIAIPRGARRVVVLANPHPRFGGTMHNAVVLALAKVACEHGAAVVRFDYRGVGASQGAYDGGAGETHDVVSAVKAAKHALPGAPVTLAGYSFGAWTALRAACARVSGAEVDRLALIAPAATMFDFKSVGAHWTRPTALVVGEHDEVCSVAQAKQIARHLDASLTVIAEESHFFYRGRRRMAERLASFLLGEGVLLSGTFASP